MSREFSSIEGCRLVLFIIVVYTFGDHASTSNFPPEIGFFAHAFTIFSYSHVINQAVALGVGTACET